MKLLMLNFTIGMINYLLATYNSAKKLEKQTPFEIFDELDDSINQLKNNTGHDISNFINNLIAFGQENPTLLNFFTFIFYSLPIINLLILFVEASDFIKNIKSEKENDNE